MANSSLDIKHEMAAYDRKDRNYFDNFTDEDRKKFSTYLMLRYGANVEGNSDMQAYYLMSTNERVNKHFFELGKHPKLQWLLCSSASPGMGTQRHYWLPAKKKESAGTSKLQKFLTSAYPTYKTDEIEVLLKINTVEDIKQLARSHGMEEKTIKKEF